MSLVERAAGGSMNGTTASEYKQYAAETSSRLAAVRRAREFFGNANSSVPRFEAGKTSALAQLRIRVTL